MRRLEPELRSKRLDTRRTEERRQSDRVQQAGQTSTTLPGLIGMESALARDSDRFVPVVSTGTSSWHRHAGYAKITARYYENALAVHHYMHTRRSVCARARARARIHDLRLARSGSDARAVADEGEYPGRRSPLSP